MFEDKLRTVATAIQQNANQFTLRSPHVFLPNGVIKHDIGGWAEVLFIPRWKEVHLANPNDSIGRAANVLGLNRRLATRLTFLLHWPNQFYHRYLEAAKNGDLNALSQLASDRIDHFITTHGEE